MKTLFMLCPLLAVLSLQGGCVTATVQEVRQANTSIKLDESIVVLGRKHKPNGAETEEDFVNCVGRKLGSSSSGVGVMPEHEFVDAMFPWFEPRTAPLRTNDLPKLIQEPMLADRLKEIGIKYLVWIDGSTKRVDSTGSMACTVATTGAACFGFLSWEDDSSYEASIWDIRKGNNVGKISSDAAGTSFVPAIIIPVPFIARVQSSACNSMSDRLKVFIKGET